MNKFLIKAIPLVVFSIMTVNIIMLLSRDRFSLYSHEKNLRLAYDRLNMLKDTNKIVIIAGSNGGFSINSRLIYQSLGIPVVNTCTHAGIGVRMQFEIYKELIHKGDIILFIPEYGGSKSRLYGESTLFRILSTHMPSAYQKLSLAQWLYLYKYIGIHFGDAIKHCDKEAFDGPYSEKALNEYGDIEFERPHKDSIVSYELSGVMDSDITDYYQYIHRYAKEHAITIVFLPPTFIESSYRKNSCQIDSIVQQLKNNGIPYQAPPIRYCFPDSLYFDTPYHMTQSGANKRTEVLIEDLKRILRKKDLRPSTYK